MANHTITKGRHSELLAITALLANGWTVAEPVAPEPFDLIAIPPGKKSQAVRIQVKTARVRPERSNSVVVFAKKNNGESYTLDDCDAFITVLDGDVYYFDNREISEYWCGFDRLDEKWIKLGTTLDSLTKISVEGVTA